MTTSSRIAIQSWEKDYPPPVDLSESLSDPWEQVEREKARARASKKEGGRGEDGGGDGERVTVTIVKPSERKQDRACLRVSSDLIQKMVCLCVRGCVRVFAHVKISEELEGGINGLRHFMVNLRAKTGTSSGTSSGQSSQNNQAHCPHLRELTLSITRSLMLTDTRTRTAHHPAQD